MRPIDADVLLAVASDMQSETEETAYNFLNNAMNPSTEWECVEGLIENAPTLDVVPVVHAHWMLFEQDEFGNIFQCSKCGKPQTTESFEDYPDVNFCSDCGAKMDEKEDGQNV